MIDNLTEAWAWLSARWRVEDTVLTADNDQAWVIIAIVVVALLVTLNEKVWSKMRFSSTLIHECSHSLVAFLTGRRLHGLKVHDDSSGVAVSSGKSRGLGMILVTIAGYPGPGALALLLAWMLSAGYAGAALTVYHTILLFGLLLVRNPFGLLTALSTILITIGITIWNDPYAVSITVIALVVLYGVGGVRGSIALAKVHGAKWDGSRTKKDRLSLKDNAKTSDAHQAFRLTLIPTWIWVAAFFSFNVFALVLSVIWLLP